ncbi:ADP-ribosyltransferase [Lachnospira eligens]|uniref:ADP-ribosyltransferase n=1 Tax=Lachnospira eligens TaxID=39485 RepID=UPI00189B7D00
MLPTLYSFIPSAVERYTIFGGAFNSKQFLSTSLIKKRALNGEYEIIIYVKKGTLCAYIEELSVFPKQRELLLDKDNIYRVLSRKDNTIELEVI